MSFLSFSQLLLNSCNPNSGHRRWLIGQFPNLQIRNWLSGVGFYPKSHNSLVHIKLRSDSRTKCLTILRAFAPISRGTEYNTESCPAQDRPECDDISVTGGMALPDARSRARDHVDFPLPSSLLRFKFVLSHLSMMLYFAYVWIYLFNCSLLVFPTLQFMLHRQ